MNIHSGANIVNRSIEIDRHGCELSIDRDGVAGEGCYFSCQDSDIRLTIGDDCMFSRNVKLMASDDHDILQGHMRINNARSIQIGLHAWLADNIIILKDIDVGSHSAVGSCSLLTPFIPDNVIAVGSPATVIKKDMAWCKTVTF